ncbi:MAG: PIG-L family deacetylase, partial [Athalassotoga sp.]
MEKTDILAISPHPDDVEIGCSGFILKARKNGYKSKIVVA